MNVHVNGEINKSIALNVAAHHVENQVCLFARLCRCCAVAIAISLAHWRWLLSLFCFGRLFVYIARATPFFSYNTSIVSRRISFNLLMYAKTIYVNNKSDSQLNCCNWFRKIMRRAIFPGNLGDSNGRIGWCACFFFASICKQFAAFVDSAFLVSIEVEFLTWFWFRFSFYVHFLPFYFELFELYTRLLIKWQKPFSFPCN